MEGLIRSLSVSFIWWVSTLYFAMGRSYCGLKHYLVSGVDLYISCNEFDLK